MSFKNQTENLLSSFKIYICISAPSYKKDSILQGVMNLRNLKFEFWFASEIFHNTFIIEEFVSNNILGQVV